MVRPSRHGEHEGRAPLRMQPQNNGRNSGVALVSIDFREVGLTPLAFSCRRRRNGEIFQGRYAVDHSYAAGSLIIAVVRDVSARSEVEAERIRSNQAEQYCLARGARVNAKREDNCGERSPGSRS